MTELTAPLAVVELAGGSYIKIEAVDATTNLPVSGVKVNNPAATAIDLSDTTDVNPPDQTPNPTGAYLPGA